MWCQQLFHYMVNIENLVMDALFTVFYLQLKSAQLNERNQSDCGDFDLDIL